MRDKDHFRTSKMVRQKAIFKKKAYFQGKSENNSYDSKVLWKILKSLGLKLSKVNQ